MLLTLEEVIKKYNVTRGAILYARQTGRLRVILKATPLTRKMYIDKDELERWLALRQGKEEKWDPFKIVNDERFESNMKYLGLKI